MISRENFKYFILFALVTMVLYKFVDNPSRFISAVGEITLFFSPFILGILFGLLLDPLVMFIEKRIKTTRLINIFIAYIIVFIILLFATKLLIPALLDTFTTIVTEVPYYIQEGFKLLNSSISSTDFLDNLSPQIQQGLNDVLSRIVELLRRFSSDSLDYILSITSILFNVSMGIILSVYILYDKEKIILGCRKIVFALYSKKTASDIVEFSIISRNIFYSYIVGKMIDSLIVGIISFVCFKFIINIDNAMFLSFIIFITNMIPYFGPFIGAIPPVLMTLTYSPVKAFWVLIFILVLQQIDGNFIGPKIMGEQVGLSPLWIISAVLLGGSLFGMFGVFLSVPVAAVIKYCLDSYIEKRIHYKDSL